MKVRSPNCVARLGPDRVDGAPGGSARGVDGEPRLVAAVGRRSARPRSDPSRRRGTCRRRSPDWRPDCSSRTSRRCPTPAPGSERNTPFSRTPAGRPGPSAVGAPAPTALPEVRRDAVELPPADRHSERGVRVDRDRRLVGRIADDVEAARIDVDLDADEAVPLDLGRDGLVLGDAASGTPEGRRDARSTSGVDCAFSRVACGVCSSARTMAEAASTTTMRIGTSAFIRSTPFVDILTGDHEPRHPAPGYFGSSRSTHGGPVGATPQVV